MNGDFHYYATYCASVIAGYSHEEALKICYSANLVDFCSRTFLRTVGGPLSAATTQLQSELADVRTDILGLQDITRIWASFHFLPRNLNALVKRGTRTYRNKYRLICGPNGELLKAAVELAKGKGYEAAGLAMHILADTWAHMYFAGTPSLVINNTDYNFRELIPCESGFENRPVVFSHNPAAADDPETGRYTASLYQVSENSIMNLGHGRAGHLPDYSFMRYIYIPAWNEYREILKDNPSDYYHAFTQMVYALKYLRSEDGIFETDIYDTESVKPYEEKIMDILTVRRISSADAWQEFGESLSGEKIPAFSLMNYQKEYREAENGNKENTYLGRFFVAAMSQKSMVTSRIFSTGSILAGRSIDYKVEGLRGIRDYWQIVGEELGVGKK